MGYDETLTTDIIPFDIRKDTQPRVTRKIVTRDQSLIRIADLHDLWAFLAIRGDPKAFSATRGIK